MLARIAVAALVWTLASHNVSAMNFTIRNTDTVVASGPIEKGDAAKFAALPKFRILELNSPGGLVGEALDIVANMDSRGVLRTVVKPGASCASACAMALFVSGKTRVVQMGGRLGIHSCSTKGGIAVPECNKAMAANATAHGVPWGVIEGFGSYTKPTEMMWLSAEDAECWGMLKRSAGDTSSIGLDCFRHASHILTEITDSNVKDADYIACRANAGTSRTYISTETSGQGFSDAYRKTCKRISMDPNTPKYAALDILLWLTLTDPNILPFKPGTKMIEILDHDENQVLNCWKCLTIGAMSMLMHGEPNDALSSFLKAADVVKRETGSVPKWLTSRIDIAKAEVAKNKQ